MTEFKGIKGFREASFLDWDGKIASVIFVGGCNFRCPFCQNYPLLSGETPDYPFHEIESFLEGNSDFIDGVVITGGEPTIYRDIVRLCSFMREKGLGIKMDTNGSSGFDFSLVDYVAMDIKAPLSIYSRASGVNVEAERIRTSIGRIMGLKDYEFRTTLVPGIVDEDGITRIGEEIRGARIWALQQFQNEHVLDRDFMGIKPYDKERIMGMKDIAESYAREVIVRGVKD